MTRPYNRTGNHSRPQPDRRQITGDLTELRVFRTRLARLVQVHRELDALGYAHTSAEVRAEMNELHDTDFVVMLPCLLCGEPAPVIVPVADTTEPGAVICGTCSAKVDLAVKAAAGGESL
jgi:hypothetical protein